MVKRMVMVSLAILLVVLLTTFIVAAVTLRPSTEGPLAGESRTGDPQPSDSSLEQEEEPIPVLTLADVRTVELTDVSGQEAWADCAYYTVYEVLLREPEENLFQPDELVTYLGLAQALADLTGEKAEENGLYQVMSAEADAENLEGADISKGTVWQAGPLTLMIPAGQENVPITRAHVASYLYQYAQRLYNTDESIPPELLTCNGGLSGYTDGDAVPAESVQDMAWALEQGLFAGMVSDTIYPDLPVTRAQLAQMLVAFTAAARGEPLAVELAGQLQVKQVDSLSQASHEELQAAVDTIAAKYGAIGLQVAVVENGIVTDSFAYGWATKGTTPMTTDHKLRVASLTKVAVGMATMELRERGLVDLDESIGTYWGFPVQNPYYPDSVVNLRSLLSHTSSIIVYGDDASRLRGSIESRLRSGGFSRTQPGNILSWNYNNYAFSVLGMTLELVSGEYLDQIMDESFWDIMGIDAAFETGSIDATDMLCTLYYYGGAVSRSLASQTAYLRPSSPAYTGSSFAGGLTISSVDLAKMVALLANDGYYQGVPLLSRESVEIMETRYDYLLADGTYQALPLRSQDDIFGRDRIYYHTGSAYGVFNCMSYDPATGDGVVVLSVGASGMKDGRNIYAVCSEISQTIYETIDRTPSVSIAVAE